MFDRLSHLDVEVEALRVLPQAEYVIEHRVAGGEWQQKCRYRDDLDAAIRRVRYWNWLLRGRRRYRVVCVLGVSRTVVYAEGHADA